MLSPGLFVSHHQQCREQRGPLDTSHQSQYSVSRQELQPLFYLVRQKRAGEASCRGGAQLTLLNTSWYNRSTSGLLVTTQRENSMNVLFASAEVAPYARAGDLGDVAGALSAALRRLGHDVRVVMPFYRMIHLQHQPVEELVPSFNVYLNNPAGSGRLLRTIMPPGNTPLYLLDFPTAFDRAPLTSQHNGFYGYPDDDVRAIIFNRGVMALAQHLRNVEGWNPDILHANDWHTALVPNYLQSNDADGLPDTASAFTIHNLAYQGKTSVHARHLSQLNVRAEVTHGLPDDIFNFTARGIIYADTVSTVSPEYAREITTPEYGEGLHHLLHSCAEKGKLYGILNGIDTTSFDPATDPHLTGSGYRTYSHTDLSGKKACKAALQAECTLDVASHRPLLAMVTRLVEHKGIEQLIATLPAVLRLADDVQIVILGSDEDPRYQAALRYIESRYGNRLRVFIGSFPPLSHRIYAGCDMIIVPSLFEPCGLTQMIAMRYGSVPVVRKTGGLADTVRESPRQNGFLYGEPLRSEWVHTIAGLAEAAPDTQDFVYRSYNIDQLLETILRALHTYRDQPEAWNQIQVNGTTANHSWDVAAQPYLTMYADARTRHGLRERK